MAESADAPQSDGPVPLECHCKNQMEVEVRGEKVFEGSVEIE